MNKYRSHNCNALRKSDVGSKVFLSGWINKKRDHGNLLFLDLRDNYGITQCIIEKENSKFDIFKLLNCLITCFFLFKSCTRFITNNLSTSSKN